MEIPVVYVQVQKESGLTSEKILADLKKEIGERAAIPKEVNLVDEIPLTQVGKIFKPALCWQAIKKAYASELEAIKDLVESMDVTVAEDKIHGSLATITVKPAAGIDEDQIENRIHQALASYTVKYKTLIDHTKERNGHKWTMKMR